MMEEIIKLETIIKSHVPQFYYSLASLLSSPNSELLMQEKNIELSNFQTLKEIGGYLKYIYRLFTEPYEVFKEFVINSQDLFKLGAMVLCAYGCISLILGHKEGKKWIPIGITLYYIIKVLVVLLA